MLDGGSGDDLPSGGDGAHIELLGLAPASVAEDWFIHG